MDEVVYHAHVCSECGNQWAHLQSVFNDCIKNEFWECPECLKEMIRNADVRISPNY